MALTAAQIVTLATQIAKCPGFTSAAGQLLNVVLQDLAQDYDFDLVRATTTITLTAGSAGPYALPSDYLRARPREVFWTLAGVIYELIPVDLAEYDNLQQVSGFSGYPDIFATDMSTSPPNLYVWPPSSGAYVTTVRYQKQPADITTPETSSTVPWFPNTNYLITRLAGELMRITGDDRGQAFLSDAEEHPDGAGSILRRYLRMKDDQEDRVQTVKLDRRRFGMGMDRLPNTKAVGF